MRRIVVSSPRSGLNWLRFVVEDQCKLRTPGKRALITKKEQRDVAFMRSHDPLGRSPRRSWFARKPKGAFQLIDPATTAGDRVALLMRDYREVFVRSCGRDFEKYRYHIGNIEFFLTAATEHKQVFYYEDNVSDPAAMARMLAFLSLEGPDGPITAERLAADWERMAAESRALYDVNQKGGGGSQTKNDPLNFKYHQEKLTADEREALDDVTRTALGDAGMAVLDRYVKDQT